MSWLQPLHARFPVPLVLSLAAWSVFALYWSAAAKNASRAISSESTKSRRLHEVLVNAALILVALPICAPGARFLPSSIWIAWFGLAVQSASCVFAVWARQHLAAHWSGEITIKIDHQLIQSGPYRFIRHPIYTGFLSMFIGAAFVSGQASALVGLIIAAFAYWRKIRLEEANLRHAFGVAYDLYRRRTGSLIPKLL